MTTEEWKKIQDWQLENKGLFIVVADPRSDSVSMSFGGLNAFVRYPMESMEKGVVFNALRQSNFEEAIGPFMVGIIEGAKMNEKKPEAAEFLRAVGGAVRGIGIEREKLKNKQIKKYGKNKKSAVK